MIIKKASKHAEANEERAERLYQVGNVIEGVGNLYLVARNLYLVARVGDRYVLYDLKTGQPAYTPATTLQDLANGCYDSSDKLVTKLTYETED